MFTWKNENMTKLQKVLSILSNVSMITGSAIGLYVLIKTYLLNRTLPAGVCPIDSSRPLLYLAIALLAFSLILSFFEPKKIRK